MWWGIEGLVSAGFFEENRSGSHENRSRFTPNPINAPVVVEDPYKVHNPNTDTLVIHTNAPGQKPLKIHDGYDAGSEMENSVFREARQASFIQRPPRNDGSAFTISNIRTCLSTIDTSRSLLCVPEQCLVQYLAEMRPLNAIRFDPW